MWVRADLRRRWRSWVVLGLLAGVSVGLACAGVAGARRAENAVPAFARAAHLPDAAILANDPAFDASVRSRIDALPEVRQSYPFMVAFLLETDRKGLEAPLVPTAPQTVRPSYGILVAGRAPDPKRADEIIVNENVRDRFGLDIGSTYTLVQRPPADPTEFPFALPSRVSLPIRQPVRVVGIAKASGDDLDTSPSSGFYAKYRDRLVGFTNEFVDLRGRPGDLARLQNDVERITGRPVNVEDAADLFGTRQLESIADVERTGLLLFALAVLVGAGALVGQALVRAVSAGGADLTTWRALGADRRIARRALVVPATITAVVGAVTGVAIAVVLSPRFPIALVRQYDLDVGFHADWLILLVGAFGATVAVVLTAWVTAELRVRRDSARTGRAPLAARWTTFNGLPPALLIGSRLATEAGRGRRAVPVRSALIGAIVGVLGVVGCLTFRSGLSDVVHDPQRSGIVWDAGVAGVGVLPPETVAAVSDDKAVAASYDALWARAIKINGAPTPTFGTKPVKGEIELVVLAGHAPRTASEIALAPTTMNRLGLHIGDRVRVGTATTPNVRVVGKALLPETSHTSYDQSAWMTAGGLAAALPADAASSGDFTEDYLLLRWKPHADSHAALARFQKLAGPDEPFESEGATLPSAVTVLGDLRVLPFSLAIFFALLAIATVAHALVTTVRRRRADLAILRSIGFTKRDSRVAIAWQATLLAIAGLVVGVPLGILAGRLAWKQLANSFPLVYAPPIAVLSILLIVPIALIIANALAAGPAHAATRIRPASVLRTE
jgi:hypothetical protein